jgi:hypothetical protein
MRSGDGAFAGVHTLQEGRLQLSSVYDNAHRPVSHLESEQAVLIICRQLSAS